MKTLFKGLILSFLVLSCSYEVRPEWYSAIAESEILLKQVVDLMVELRFNPSYEYKEKAKTIYKSMEELNTIYKKYVDTLSKDELAQFRTEYYAMEKRVTDYQVYNGFDAKIDIFQFIAKLAQ